MSETRTFKNVYGVFDTASAIHAGWDVQCTEDLEPAEFFNSDEWDMEVAFTRKVKPVEVGDVVRHLNWPVWHDSGEPIFFVVKAIIEDQAWIGYADKNREDMLTPVERLYFDD